MAIHQLRQFFKNLVGWWESHSEHYAHMGNPSQAKFGEVSTPPIPERLMSQQLPQKDLVAGVESLLPQILNESKKYGDVVQVFLAITVIETVEETKGKFWFITEQEQELKPFIMFWAQVYQDTNYNDVLPPPIIVTVHWGFTPITW